MGVVELLQVATRTNVAEDNMPCQLSDVAIACLVRFDLPTRTALGAIADNE